ncbi:hypothetical protein [Pararhizobium sp. DWP3-4]|uniref:hypothetical protein n=1 Tax=unclassified Pararhizobium TaxID=2643050 RepID=UPI003CE94842
MDREVTLPALGIVLSLTLGALVVYSIVFAEPAPTAAVEGKEQKNTQPAGPLDKSALPGSKP